MNLRDFIRETIVEIVVGVHEARVEVKNLVAICPSTLNGAMVEEKSYIEFDIAVGVNETIITTKDGKGEVKAEINILGNRIGGGVDVGSNTVNNAQSEKISKVAFKVPVLLNANYRKVKSLQEDAALIEDVAKRLKK